MADLAKFRQNFQINRAALLQVTPFTPGSNIQLRPY